MVSQGILYIVTGEKYIRAAMRSARTVHKFSPDLSIHLYADWRNYDFKFDKTSHPFTSISEITDPHRRSKVDFMSLTPFDQTLYLDSDTALHSDIRDIFRLLENFDIALAHAHRRNFASTSRQWRYDITGAFPQFNSGVILFRKSLEIQQLLENWGVAFQAAGFAQDQVTLRELLWGSDLRIATLPPEYNVRFLKYHYFWAKAEAETKIFHLKKYHEGPFWFLKAWGKRVARALMKSVGIDPEVLKKRING